MLAAAAVVTTTGALLLPFNVLAADAAVVSYRTTTQYIGGGSTVNVRSAPSTSSTVVYTLGNGSQLSIECQTVGSKLGFSAYSENRTWNKLSNGRYVHDVVTTTPAGPHQALPDGGYVAYSPTIPRCDLGGSTESATQTNSYPDADAVNCSATYGAYSWCKGGRWYSSRGFGYKNCTDFVAWKVGLTVGQVSLPSGRANAADWKTGWADRGRATGSAPRVGAIAWWGTEVAHGYGHVGVVIGVNSDGSAQVAQYNWDGQGNYSVNPTARADAYLYR